MALIKCKECKHKISKTAKTCPNCGAINKKKRSSLGAGTGLVILIALVWIGTTITEDNYKTKKVAQEKAATQQKTTHFNNNKTTIIADINKNIKAKQYQAALTQLKKYKHTNDPDITKLYPIVKEQTILAELKTIPASQHNTNLKLYKELLSLQPGNSKYKTKATYYQKKVDDAEAKRTAQINKFGKPPIRSAWDGSYNEVEQYLKSAAHNPDSIDIENCSNVYHSKSGWLVRCTYRGSNAFGAIVRNTHWFNIIHNTVTQQHDASAFKL